MVPPISDAIRENLLNTGVPPIVPKCVPTRSALLPDVDDHLKTGPPLSPPSDM